MESDLHQRRIVLLAAGSGTGFEWSGVLVTVTVLLHTDAHSTSTLSRIGAMTRAADTPCALVTETGKLCDATVGGYRKVELPT